MLLILKTNPGLEDLAADECRSILGWDKCRPFDLRVGEGRIYVEAEGEVDRLVMGSRLLTGIVLLMARERLDCASTEGCEREIRRLAREVEWARVLSRGDRFAVRAERIGEFPLTSPRLASIVGDAIASCVSDVAVHLNSPSRVVVAEVDWGVLNLGIVLGGEEGLHRRWYRVREHMASLKPTIAHAMLALSGVRDGDVLLDPLCGGGTIPIEALLYHEWLTAYCSDRSAKSLDAARANAAAAGVLHRLSIFKSDVSRVSTILSKRVDHIVTNPPYGLRVGDPRVALRVLERLLEQSHHLLERGGHVTLLFPNKAPVGRKAMGMGFAELHSRKVRHGDLDLWLMVFEKEVS